MEFALKGIERAASLVSELSTVNCAVCGEHPGNGVSRARKLNDTQRSTPRIHTLRVKFKIIARMIAPLLLSCLPALTSAQQLPSIMVIDGVINDSGSIRPQVGDTILATDNAGKIEGDGSVVDDLGGFFMQISKTTDFNNTELTLILRQGDLQGQLLQGTEPFKFRFTGGFPLTRLSGLSLTPGNVVAVLPADTATGTDTTTGTTTTSDTTTGATTSDTTTGDTTTGATTTSDTTTADTISTPFDIDGDGRFTQNDIDFVKSVVAGRVKDNGKADSNKDNIVNTRDIIELIKEFRRQHRPSATPTRPSG